MTYVWNVSVLNPNLSRPQQQHFDKRKKHCINPIMGGKASKIAAGSGLRRYPTRVPQPHPPNQSAQTTASAPPSSISTGVGPTIHPKTQAAFEKTDGMGCGEGFSFFCGIMFEVDLLRATNITSDPERRSRSRFCEHVEDNRRGADSGFGEEL